VLDYQKLSWLNGVHLRNLPPGEYAARVLTYLGEQGIDWDASLVSLAERLGLKPREAFQPIRVAVTGSKISPGLFESLELLGREQSLARLSAARGAVA
jgi:glutamyl/glutaminyl-tRNA synthetase